MSDTREKIEEIVDRLKEKDIVKMVDQGKESEKGIGFTDRFLEHINKHLTEVLSENPEMDSLEILTDTCILARVEWTGKSGVPEDELDEDVEVMKMIYSQHFGSFDEMIDEAKEMLEEDDNE